MIRSSEDDREKLRVLWFKDSFEANSKIVDYRLNKLVFGLWSSPVILGIGIKQFGLFLQEGILKYYGRINKSSFTLSSKQSILLPQNHIFALTFMKL